jgi:GMP synthase-like glutamine amidotransferase
MAVLIIKNIPTEGPGTIKDFLKKEQIPFKIIELGSGETPPPLQNYDTLIVLGGPLGVYNRHDHPQLLSGSRVIREALNRDMKILGICLGAQMLAHCLGADVYPGTLKEIGWFHVELTGEGLRDPLMRKLAIHPRVGDFWRKFKVFHWHGDTFDIPPGTVLLASSKLYKHQAFKFGNKAYGFQFHIEVTKEIIIDWLQDSADFDPAMKETEKIYEEYTGRAFNFYKSFFKK